MVGLAGGLSGPKNRVFEPFGGFLWHSWGALKKNIFLLDF
jgi:hypothetical protein